MNDMKSPPKRSKKLPKFELYGWDNAEATKRLVEEARKEQLKTYSLRAEKDPSQPTWEDVAHLYANQINMLQTISKLQELLEDPFIASIVSLKERLDETKSELRSLKEDYDTHTHACSDRY